jgi:Uma2 family endonuclease
MTADLLDDVTLRMPRREWVFDDLPRLPDDGRRYEVIDGSLHVSPAPTPRHQLASARLARLLAATAPDHLEVIETVGVVCGRSVLAPDVVVVRAEAFEIPAVRLLPSDLRLAVEVMSPSSVRMDRLVKPSVYAEAGVPAFWRVELDGPGTPLVVVCALDGDAYREVVTVRAGDVVTMGAPYPVELRPAELVGPRRKG